jgi:hypothetical protein
VEAAVAGLLDRDVGARHRPVDVVLVDEGQDVAGVGIVDELPWRVDVDEGGQEARPAVGRLLEAEAVIQRAVALL